jgi:hypothetical protein
MSADQYYIEEDDICPDNRDDEHRKKAGVRAPFEYHHRHCVKGDGLQSTNQSTGI